MTPRIRLVGALLTACLLTTVTTEINSPALAQSRRSLRRKQEQISGKMSAVRSELRNVKAEQATAKNSLSRAQYELVEAQDRLDVAASKLSRTRSSLKVVRKEHQAATEQHAVQRKRMESRIRAQWEAGNPSYLEVLLDSTTFADFTQRAEMTETIADRDHNLLGDLLAAREEMARKQQLLQAKEAEEQAAKREVQADRNQVAQKATVAKQRLKSANEDRAEIERQYAALDEASRDIEAMMSRVQRTGGSAGGYEGKWSGSLLRPVPGRVTSGFGWRIHPITHTRRFHYGVDLACGGGTPIHAADKGRVVHAGWWGPNGVCVIIDHGSGISTVYAHCARGSVRVGVGDTVSRGQVVAGVDSTGWSTGNHLHFEVRRYGQAVNPLSY
jgi:murein DD-endopeptidase MepM/ murein hydrolase activator NlpD